MDATSTTTTAPTTTTTSVPSHGWYPLILTRPVFLYSLAFYIVISILARQIVKLIWRGNNCEEAEEGGFASQHRKRDTIGNHQPLLLYHRRPSLGAPSLLLNNETIV
jgi:hypothetical protein